MEPALRLPARIAQRLRLPLIAAPMLRVSGPELVAAACKAGVIAAVPTKNARTTDELEVWLTRTESLASETAQEPAPYCPNLIIRDSRRDEDLRCIIHHKVEMDITSVGSPAPVIAPLHDAGCLVFADIATLEHARKAIDVGADGLVLLTAGAGGQTGWLNPFAFVRAVHATYDGPIVLAGGMSDGYALWAARVLGSDLAYMGTKFIATRERMAQGRYREMLVYSTIGDVVVTRNFTGLRANYLAASIAAAGISLDKLEQAMDEERARRKFGGQNAVGPRRWVDIWSAGHSESGVDRVQTVGEFIEHLARECADAQASVPMHAFDTRR